MFIIVVAALSAGCGSDDTGTSGDAQADTAGLDDVISVGDTAVLFDTTADITDDADSSTASDAFGPEVIQPGEFGAPCIENLDCFSGYCVTSDEGPVCTRTCTEDCPGGWSCVGITGQIDVAFLCLPRQNRLCQACALDGQCHSGYCIALSEGNRCTVPCDDEDACEPGYRCEERESELNPGDSSKQCVPENDACDCVPGKEGFVEACQNSNEFGTCTGLRTCQGLTGWGLCDAATASAEVCDGDDNNCNRLIDENLTGETCPITNEFGTCTGLRVCEATDGQTCVGRTPAAETCNYLDDNCDGQTDDGFRVNERYVAVTTCGNCFTNCATIFDRPNAFGTCDSKPAVPTCRMDCDNRYFDLNVVPGDGCEFLLDPDAIYVGTDSPGAGGGACGLGPVGTGSGNFPCATIAQGFARATATGRSKLIVADGLYAAQVTITNGVSLLGGYRADTWERHLSSTATIIRGPEGDGDRKAIIATGINQATHVEGFVVNAANATTRGANSYGIYIQNSTSALTLSSNLIFAGLGGLGSAGQAGTSGDNGQGGSSGASTKHLSSCSSNPNNSGGSAGAKTCTNPTGSGSTDVGGGKGGNSVCPAINVQEGGGAAGKNSGGAGGAGGWGHNSSANGCNPSSGVPEVGELGRDAIVGAAQDGARGDGCNASLGVIAGGEWRGTAGAFASHGAHGAGGGGGGAGSGGIISTSSYDISGSGGGGGSGGCAGARGAGGSPGGASIGIFVYWASASRPSSAAGVPVITGNAIVRNQGGPGGSGGNGGAGGDPGAGGNGGALNTSGLVSPVFCVFGGAKGGFGSRGGHGGGGGGGCGGVSFDILAWGINGQPHRFGENSFPNGNLDTGGDGGNGGNSSNTQRGGTSGTTGASTSLRAVD